MRSSGRTLLAGVAVAALAASGCGSSTKTSSTATSATGSAGRSAATGTPVLVGEDLDSTGPGASYSVIAGKTIQEAVADVNQHGGVLHGRPLKLVVENDESDPTKTPAVIKKLAGEGAKAMLLQSGGAAVIQAKSTLEQLAIPAITPTSVTQTVAEPPDNNYIYTLANSTSDWAKVYCGAFQKAGITKLGVLSDDTTTLAALDKALFAGMPCVRIVDTEKGSSTASDLTAQVARLKSAKPDAVLVTAVGGAFETLAQDTLASQMTTATRFSLASIGNEPSAWKLATPGGLNGLIFMGSIDNQNPKTQQLEAFLKAHNGSNYVTTAFDANGWDAVQLLKTAIDKAGSDDPKTINQALQGITGYQASFGQPGFTLSFSATKHLGADGLCGLSMIQFGKNNTPASPWPVYQPPCSS